MPLIDITAPAAEPVTSAEVKAAAGIDDSTFDAQIDIIIPAMRRAAEQRLGRRLITQTVELVLDEFPAAEIDLQLPDVQAITSVKYLEPDAGVETTLAGTEYSLDGDSTPCWLLPSYDAGAWPSTRDTTNAVRIRFTCGYGNAAANVPSDIRLWIIAQCVQAINAPCGFAQTNVAPLPYVDRLLDAQRVFRVG
jgi:uncharacterized phiE125 gp8 family phage protein